MNERVARCHLIASVLAADGIITDDERAFLKRAMDQFGLNQAEQDEVTHFEPSGDAMQVVQGMPEAARQAMVDELVEAALVDGKLGPQEMALVRRLTLALGLDG